MSVFEILGIGGATFVWLCMITLWICLLISPFLIWKWTKRTAAEVEQTKELLTQALYLMKSNRKAAAAIERLELMYRTQFPEIAETVDEYQRQNSDNAGSKRS